MGIDAASHRSEDAEPEHQLVLGGELARSTTLLASRRATRRRLGDAEPTRFGRYARRLWDGLLAHEDVVDR